MMTFYFDMDGTIADLYGVDGWLDKLIAEDSSPYEDAKTLVDTQEAQNTLSWLQKQGCRIGVITWLSKNSTKEYDEKVTEAKKRWLKRHFPDIEFDEMHIVPYGTNKYEIAEDKSGIIFDDDERVRDSWDGTSVDPTNTDIVGYLKDKKESASGCSIWVRSYTKQNGVKVKGHWRKCRKGR